MNNETTTTGKRIEQINYVIIGSFVLMMLLIHGTYILYHEKKELEGKISLDTRNITTQRIINKGIGAIIIIMLLWFDYSNLKELEDDSKSTEEDINIQSLRVFTSILAVIIVFIEIYIQFHEYNNAVLSELDDVIL